MTTDPQTLFSLANCYRCYGVNGSAQLLKLGLLKQIVLTINPMADTSPQALFNSTKCYNCYTNADMGTLLELGLLLLIAGVAGAATGGAPDYIDYAGPPLLNPPDLQHIVTDVNGRQWQYYAGGWN